MMDFWSRLLGGVGVVAMLGLAACAPSEREPVAEQSAEPESSAPAVVEIEAAEYAFTGPPTLPSGWVTLRFVNSGKQDHFLVLWKLPEGHTFGEYASDIAGKFEQLYVRYRSGELEQGAFLEELGGSLPEWFFSTRRMGGPGFTAPGHTSQTTVYLEPGDYVMECYVRAMEQDDTFHGSLGMLRPLIVTEASSGAEPPEPDVDIVLSNYQIAVSGDLAGGSHTARVRVEEDPEGLILHNVHLARLDDDTSAAEVAQWMDWVDHMLPPAPAEFLGGAGQAGAGAESYYSFELSPGRYAWVSETWGAQGMIHEFTVE